MRSIWWTFAYAGSGWKIIPSLSEDLSSDPDPRSPFFRKGHNSPKGPVDLVREDGHSRSEAGGEVWREPRQPFKPEV